MESIEQRMAAKLAAREAEGNRRTLTVSSGKADFCSNDYLGLARNAQLHERIQRALREPVNGSTGSRLISGNNTQVTALEQWLAAVFQAGGTLIFNSGYSANTAILSAVPQKGDTILYDEYIHASLKEGARLSFAARYSFRHNDLSDLERKLQRATGEIFVVAESVYSMDGDFAPLAELLERVETYGAHLIWDEAHSTGMWGAGGNGLACESGLHARIFARIYTFGKAMGVHGALIAGSPTLIDYLVNFARPFIYTTALPPHSLAAIREAFEYLHEHPETVRSLHRNIRFFTERLDASPALHQCRISSRSPIQAIKIGGNERTKRVAAQVQTAGFDVRPILAPTVPAGEERLRICLHVYNTEEQMTQLLDCLAETLASLE